MKGAALPLLVANVLAIAYIGGLAASLVARERPSAIYESKGAMCGDLAQRYLRTIRYTVIPERDQEQWTMAVDVETDLYKLCMLDLRGQPLGAFESVVSAKYGNSTASRDATALTGKVTPDTEVKPPQQ